MCQNERNEEVAKWKYSEPYIKHPTGDEQLPVLQYVVQEWSKVTTIDYPSCHVSQGDLVCIMDPQLDTSIRNILYWLLRHSTSFIIISLIYIMLLFGLVCASLGSEACYYPHAGLKPYLHSYLPLV